MLFLLLAQVYMSDSEHAKAGYGAWGGLCGHCVALHFLERTIMRTNIF
jgi:hypothetical protein